MVDQMNATSFAFEDATSEFERIGVASLPSHVVAPPRVAGAPMSFECTRGLGHAVPTCGAELRSDLGKVIAAHVDPSIVAADGQIDPVAMDPVSRWARTGMAGPTVRGNFNCRGPPDDRDEEAANVTTAEYAAGRGLHGISDRRLHLPSGLAATTSVSGSSHGGTSTRSRCGLPMKALIEEMDARLAVLMPEITGTVKGSMFRIHRDVRFSKDKSPYKTNAACWFYHRDSRGNVGQDAVHGGAGLYFHLEPRACFAGGGVWMPPSPVLQRIRAALDVGHEEFTAIVSARAFRSTFGELSKEAVLTRMPRGFAPDHPAADWLRFQSFTAGCALTQGEVTAATLPDRLESIYRTLVPFVRWLNKAMGFRAHSSR